MSESYEHIQPLSDVEKGLLSSIEVRMERSDPHFVEIFNEFNEGTLREELSFKDQVSLHAINLNNNARDIYRNRMVRKMVRLGAGCAGFALGVMSMVHYQEVIDTDRTHAVELAVREDARSFTENENKNAFAQAGFELSSLYHRIDHKFACQPLDIETEKYFDTLPGKANGYQSFTKHTSLPAHIATSNATAIADAKNNPSTQSFCDKPTLNSERDKHEFAVLDYGFQKSVAHLADTNVSAKYYELHLDEASSLSAESQYEKTFGYLGDRLLQCNALALSSMSMYFLIKRRSKKNTA